MALQSAQEPHSRRRLPTTGYSGPGAWGPQTPRPGVSLMGPSSPAGGAACLPPHMTEVGAKARGTVGWDRSVTKCYAPRLFLMGRRTPFKRHLFSIGLSAVVEKVGKQKVLHVSRATREVLRAGRKAPWRLLASTATLPGWSAMVRSTVRHRRGLRRLGGGAPCPCGSCFSHGSPP